ncbi:Myosin type-2 heavy chain 1 [Allomyces javanicus]|nr:Myosin type-2 heavy chain 1 [Allomyces javanicus]
MSDFNLQAVPNLTEEAVLDVLRQRFYDGAVYTPAGDMIIAVNPCTSDHAMPANQELLGQVAGRARVAALRPVNDAHACPNDGLERAHDQIVLISGDSGAGKTSTLNRLLAHLTNIGPVAGCDPRESSPPSAGTILAAANELMEAWGNAGTQLNPNSSRFCRFIDLGLDRRSASLCRLSVRSFLLETARVTGPARGERNFHALHHFAVAAAHGRAVTSVDDLGVAGVERWSYLGAHQEMSPNSESLDAICAALNRDQQAAQMLGVSWADLERVLAIVLHLGNIAFVSTAAAAPARVDPNCLPSLATAENLLGQSPGTLATWLTVKHLSSPTATTRDAIFRHRTVVEATAARDALARTLYERVLLHLVDRTNEVLAATLSNSTESEDNIGWIGLVDVFGFEHFGAGDNGLEQLLINYVNERLHAHYTWHTFERERRERVEEGLTEVEGVRAGYVENDGVVQLLDGKLGVFDLLNEESLLRHGSDTSFLHKLRTTTTKSHTTFCVPHYAQPVTYTATGLVDRNRGASEPEVLRLLSTSTSPFLHALAAAAPLARTDSGVSTEQTPKRSRTAATHAFLAAKTVARTRDLLNLIHARNAHFIRCIKPNASLTPRVFDAVAVSAQLRATGVVAACAAMRRRARKWGVADLAAWVRPLAVSLGIAAWGNADDVVRAVLAHVTATMPAVGDGMVEFGRSAVFLQPPLVEALVDLRGMAMDRSVTKIQAVGSVRCSRATGSWCSDAQQLGFSDLCGTGCSAAESRSMPARIELAR